MYRCEVCQNLVPPKQHRRTHQLLRTIPGIGRWDAVRNRNESTDRTEIVREVPVCDRCDEMLKNGIPFAMLLKQRGVAKQVTVVEVEVKSEPPPSPVVNRPVQVGRPVNLSTLPLERLGNFEVLKKKRRGRHSKEAGIKDRKVK